MSKRFIGARQTTIAREIELQGKGVHSGAPVSVVLHPAGANTGIKFLVNKRGRIIAEIPAEVGYVKNLTLCTVIGDDAGVSVGTVEHLLAALRGLSIDNCYVELDAPEPPGLDGSASGFVDAITSVGVQRQSAERPVWTVREPLILNRDGATLGLHPLRPTERPGLKITYSLDYGPGSPIPPPTCWGWWSRRWWGSARSRR